MIDTTRSTPASFLPFFWSRRNETSNSTSEHKGERDRRKKKREMPSGFLQIRRCTDPLLPRTHTDITNALRTWGGGALGGGGSTLSDSYASIPPSLPGGQSQYAVAEAECDKEQAPRPGPFSPFLPPSRPLRKYPIQRIQIHTATPPMKRKNNFHPTAAKMEIIRPPS